MRRRKRSAAQPGRQSRRVFQTSPPQKWICSSTTSGITKVHVGNVRRLSRHLVAETRSPAKISAVPKEEVKSGEKKDRPTRHSNVGIHLPKVDLGKAEREMKEKTEQGQQELEKRDEEIRNDAQEDMCTPPLQDEEAEQAEEHPQELQNLRQAWQSIIQTEDLEFEDIADLAGETMELGEAKKDKSAGRRFLNWLDERKNARTYRRALEEGDQLYRTSYMARPMTRAQREQRKWQKQSAEKLLDAHWEMRGHMKEVLRLKEKERHEGWAAGHGLSVPDSSPEQPKKRMSKWEKRFLGVKESFSC
ncbi:uncharacterized protein LOC122863345 [Siniperca chuatsi]|uniref:uncharacterized protein LOC122863345 n=1 Tax=Siniperca chuatsi TaxID=119488 RepID=UPI001CE1BE76|nr:uncharacterized protein LOC122863345 [Siniperca chuatsi]